MSDSLSGWEALLGDRLGRRVEVVYRRARTAPVVLEDDGRVVRVRLHRFFRQAPPEVAEDLALWLRNGRRSRRAARRLDAWIDARLAELPPAPSRRVTLRPRGEVHDLTPLAASLFHAEFLPDFEGRPRPDVTWGRRARSRARRSLQLGSYEPDRHVVRVHPVLDQEAVPGWFVRYVLFHEILHAALPQLHHGSEFLQRERRYVDHERALAWQRARIGKLIRAARRAAERPARRAGERPVFRQGWLFTP